MKKLKEIAEIIFILVTFLSAFFSKKVSIRVLSSLFMISYLIISRLRILKKRKKAINELNENDEAYIECKENNFYCLLISISLLTFSGTNIDSIINSKNKLNGFVDFFNQTSTDEKGLLFVYCIIIMIAIIMAIEWFRGTAIINSDYILFYDDIKFEISEVTNIKYKDALFSNKTIIKLRTEYDQKEIIPKVKDFERVKTFLEAKVDGR